MAAPFGELLGRFVPLSSHDVAEILQEQSVSRHRFGEIALRWGLCRPDHIWRAWGVQLAQQPQQVDLAAIGIDTQAVAHLDAKLARAFHAIPVRALDDQLIVATTESGLPRALEHLPLLLNRQVQFVVADDAQIDAAIREYYSEGP